MLVFSEQYRIVSNIAISFSKGLKTGKSFSFKELERAKIHLKPQKFESTPKNDFTFIVLWLSYCGISGTSKLLKRLQDLDKEEIKDIYKERDKFIRYKNTINEDLKIINSVTNPLKILDKVSPFGIYLIFKMKEPRGRIQTKKYQRVSLFLDYFPTIKKHLNNVL